MNSISQILKLIRVQQWTKNLLVFAPGFFAGELSRQSFWVLLAGFSAMCLFSSCVYVLNDYLDRETDREDENKKHCPLAKGLVSVRIAMGVFFVFLIVGSGLLLLVPLAFVYIIIVYLGINILYSFWLKHLAIVDVVIISIGFLLRMFGGGILVNVELSKWLMLLTFFMALLIAFAKRRNELLHVHPEKNRPALKGYSLPFTDFTISTLSGACLIFYVMYTIDTEVTERLNSSYVYLTVIWVVLGFLRYLQQVFVHNNAGAPAELLLQDHWLTGIILLWLGSFYYFLYV